MQKTVLVWKRSNKRHCRDYQKHGICVFSNILPKYCNRVRYNTILMWYTDLALEDGHNIRVLSLYWASCPSHTCNVIVMTNTTTNCLSNVRTTRYNESSSYAIPLSEHHQPNSFYNSTPWARWCWSLDVKCLAITKSIGVPLNYAPQRRMLRWPALLLRVPNIYWGASHV